MKKLLVLGISVVALTAFLGTARADAPTKQEGRIWIDQHLLLIFTPNWSLTTMPGARTEFYRSREGSSGLQFLELFFGPNYTYKTGNWTFKGSLWYYYMGYPQRGRLREGGGADGMPGCSTAPLNPSASLYCTSTYNASHNLEIIPSVEYRWGRWSLYDRVILHNTFYADVYSTPVPDKSVSDLRWGWGTVIRQLLQLRYAVNDRLGVFVSDEVFLGAIEDGDTSALVKTSPDGSKTKTGYTPLGYWKRGLRYNRTYVGFDYKITPTFTVAPAYMMEIGLHPTNSTDVTDLAHTFFMVMTVAMPVNPPPPAAK